MQKDYLSFFARKLSNFSIKQNSPNFFFYGKEVQAIKTWCGRQDLNLQGCPLDSKSNASANFATSAKARRDSR